MTRHAPARLPTRLVEATNMSLNSAQAHALSSALMQLEQSLADIERLLDGPVAGVTQTFVTDMSPITVQQVR